jgi:CheY-like chemotaxis protein/CRP-like cAMP-binding protein
MAKERIVVIEDNKDMRENLSEILELSGYEVKAAPNGKVGLELIQQITPDLIICDIMMPELDGYGVIHILQQNPNTANIPFIFLTAKVEKADFRKGMNLGADDYVTKPFEDIDLLNAVELRLRKSFATRNQFASASEGLLNFFDRLAAQRGQKAKPEKRQHHVFKKKEYLFIEGESPKDIYLVRSGKIKTFKTNAEGKELITSIYVSGNLFGYLPVLESAAHSESAVALEDADVVMISKSEFLEAVYSNKEVAGQLIKMLSNHVLELEQRLIDIAYKSVRQRVATALLQIKHLYQSSANSSASFLVARKDLSGMVGTATESLNRTLADFKDEGLVEISDHSLKITDIKQLEKIAR